MTGETIKTFDSDYTSFYRGYIERVKPGSIHQIFSQDTASRQNLFPVLNDSDDLSGYAPGKWSIKEVLQHCIDTERIFTVRALMLSRCETQEIPGYDQDEYAANSNAESRGIEKLRIEWTTVRQATFLLFESFQPDDFKKSGIVNGNKLSVRAIPFIIVGHALHHLQVLRVKYGVEF